MVTEHPILFSGPMVRAILDGRKSQTRRLVRRERSPDPGHTWDECLCREIDPNDTPCLACEARFGHSPYGRPGDRLWVREAHWILDVSRSPWPDQPHRCGGDGQTVHYRAGCDLQTPRWRPSIYMPRWASRLTLDVAKVCVERLQAISEADAVAEGLCDISTFSAGWDGLNGRRGPWDANPWVWVVTFRVVPGEVA